MADAVFRSGEPTTIKYTPAADIAVGQVVPLITVAANNTGLGMTLGIATQAIANGVLGALSFGGVWDVTTSANVANYATVYWDDATKKVTNTSTNNSLFGYVTDRNSASGDVTNTTVACFCWPITRS